jgi:hypothetical protein
LGVTYPSREDFIDPAILSLPDSWLRDKASTFGAVENRSCVRRRDSRTGTKTMVLSSMIDLGGPSAVVTERVFANGVVTHTKIVDDRRSKNILMMSFSMKHFSFDVERRSSSVTVQ